MMLPGPGGRLDVREPGLDAQFIAGTIIQSLEVLQHQLDLLIKLEVGYVTKEEIREKLQAHDEKLKAEQAND